MAEIVQFHGRGRKKKKVDKFEYGVILDKSTQKWVAKHSDDLPLAHDCFYDLDYARKKAKEQNEEE